MKPGGGDAVAHRDRRHPKIATRCSRVRRPACGSARRASRLGESCAKFGHTTLLKTLSRSASTTGAMPVTVTGRSLAARGQRIGQEREADDVVQMGVRDEGVLDGELLGDSERTGDRAGIDEDAVVHEEARRALAETLAAKSAEHAKLHLGAIVATCMAPRHDKELHRSGRGRAGSCRSSGRVLEHAHDREDFDYPTMARALILGDKDTVARKTREGLDWRWTPRTSSSRASSRDGRRRREVPPQRVLRARRCCCPRAPCTPGSISSSR